MLYLDHCSKRLHGQLVCQGRQIWQWYTHHSYANFIKIYNIPNNQFENSDGLEINMLNRSKTCHEKLRRNDILWNVEKNYNSVFRLQFLPQTKK